VVARSPPGYSHVPAVGAQVIALETARDSIARIIAVSGTIHGHAAASASAKPLRGRGVSWAFEVDGERWVVRHFRRGGAMARLLEDRYLRVGASRPARELQASQTLRARGVDTPEVIAYAIYPVGIYYRADIVTRWIADSEDLASVTFGPDARSAVGRAAAWAAAGLLLHSAFEHGAHHPDLNLRNILVAGDQAQPTAWLIDLDRCRVHTRVTPAARRNMLERFHRSRRKLERRFRRPVGAAALAAFEEKLRG
jgi:3-deoxy-D-manno-octulosonic acid kinase